MKNLKKVLALVIALTMVLTTVAFASYPDVDANANYASAVELLSALEILQGDENGNFNPDNTITRAEYAAVVCRALGMENAANSAKGATIFTDVAADHWATGYINLASQQGIVNGKGNGIFDPEGNVTYAEAVKMLVVALGYEPMAASRGGYPTGYLTVANSTKITANVSSSGTDTAALRSTVAQLTANALEVANMDQTGFGTDTKFEVLDDYDNYTTLLTKMDIYKATGVVNSVDASEGTMELKLTEASDDYEFGYMNNKGDAYTDFNTVERTVSFDTNGVNVDAYLQQSVDVYVYKAGKSDYDVVYITASGIGSSLKIDAGDLATGAATIKADARTVVEYYENSDATKTTKIDVEKNAPVYVNGYKFTGVTYPADLAALLDGKDATVEFVENTDDKYYDMVLVTMYEHGIVDTVEVAKEKINFLDSTSIKFDSSDSKQVVNLQDKNGNEIELKDIKDDDVLAMLVEGDSKSVSIADGKISVAKARTFAKNSNKITVVDLGNNVVTGTIDSSDDKKGDYKIYIDGTEYEVSNFVDGNYGKVYKEQPASSTDPDEAKLGTEGTFYLDINGKVIGFDGTAGGNTTYGYILQAEYNTSNSFDKGWEIKMLTQKNGIVTYTLNSSYDIVGKSGKSADDKGTSATAADKFLSAFSGKTNYNKTAIKDRVVEYKVTSDSKIKTIDALTGKDVAAKSTFKESTGKVGGVVLSNDVVVFDISDSDIDDVTTTDISALVDDGEYTGYAADLDGSEYSVFVMTQGDTKFNAEDGFYVVESFRKSTYNNDDSVVVSYYDADGQIQTAIFTTDSKSDGSSKYENLKKGDVFVANMNSEKVVKDYVVLAKLNAAKNGVTVVEGAFYAAYGSDYQTAKLDEGADYVFGYITNIDSRNGKQLVEVCYDNVYDATEKAYTNAYTLTITNSTNQYMYTYAKNDKVEFGDWNNDTVDDVDENGKCTAIFAKMYDGVVTDVYTFNNRQDKFVGASSAAATTGTTTSVKTEVKDETKADAKVEAPVVEVPVAEEDFE